ncbi:TP53-regulated inhibitor of apoptosis 1-like [Montipora capricornis]|uniref:TP53-regulated inhibitor of apoptosis 1-like n=1 Tax=Montipora foliosa TaxID=591990 RepID=UPI0035F12AFB
MNSIGPECNDLKKEYDACFNVWYSESFLKGEYKTDPCGELLKSYRSCVLKAIKERNIDLSDIEANILGTDNEKQPPLEK